VSAPAPTTVLIVDDSPTVRAVLRRLIGRTDDLTVAGEAGDGEEAVALASSLRPDVVLMDIEMPRMDGYTATERIMAQCPTAILVLTSRADRDSLRTAFDAVRHGALEVIPKPTDAAGWERLATTLPTTVRGLARAHLVRPGGNGVGPHRRAPELAANVRSPLRYLAIGASTGGPGALRDLLNALSADVLLAVLVVQHIAAGFEQGLAEWLAADLRRDVRLAREGETPPPGGVRLAPGGVHLVLGGNGRIHLDAEAPPRGGHRPSADELFLSCARHCPREAAGVLLSGMGSDGAEGLAALRAAGGLTMVQDEATSVVFGMPGAALARGATRLALPPREIGLALRRHCLGGAP
jgi:two-component system, chemotaxis family, protein-glutamate methylesterase/glutaminase